MPFQQWLLVNVPAWLIITFMLAIAVGISVGGVLLVRRFVKVGNLKRDHDIAGPIFSTLGVVYAVLLAFAIVIVWQNFDTTKNNVVLEANCYGDIYRDLVGLPEPFRGEVKLAIDDYVNAIINDEWKLLAVGQRSMVVQGKSDKIWNMLGNFEPRTDREKIFLSEILKRANDGGALRRQRIADASSGIHPVLWFVLLFGGVITVVFTFFFGSDNLRAQMLMTTLLAVLIVLILFTILIMDFPFSGSLYIGPDSFQQVLSNLKG
jgi:hypothetical protein